MKKIKNWLRNKLSKFLGIDDIISLIDKHIDHNDKTFTALKEFTYNLNYSTRNDLKKDISHFQESVNVLHNTVENVVHIGTDIHRENTGHSWAVVCVEGKMNIVKFVDLDRKDAREVMNFLKSFEAGRHCIDTPYKEMFYDGLFEF